MSITAKPPYKYFTDAAGEALEAGKIYVGVAGLDAEANPITAYWDSAATVAAVQPIRTIGGAPDNSGTPSDFFTKTDYSITVRDSNDVLIYSKLQLNANDPDNLDLFKTYDTVADLLASTEAARGVDAVWRVEGPDGNFSYIEAVSGDITTAGSVQLDVQDWNAVALGAVEGGVIDASDAINYGILNAPFSLDIPEGVFAASNILLSRSDIVINGPKATLKNIATDGSPLFTMSAASNFRRSVIDLYAVENVALSGDIFDLNTSSFSDNEVTIQHLTNSSTNGRILTNQNGTADGTLFFTTFRGTNWTIAAGCTANNQILVIGSDNICSVVTFDFRDFRHLATAGVNCFYFESTSAIGASFNQILLKNFGVEKTHDGFAVFKGCHASGVENMVFYDMSHGGGTIDASLIVFNSGSGGTTSEGSYARDIRRQDGTLNTGIYDIEALNDNIYLENIGARLSGNGFTVNLNSNRVLVNGYQNVTFDNLDYTKATLVDASDGVSASYVKALKSVVGDGSTLVIATGEITVTGSFHIVNTEASAATDDLDTINGGEIGMTLVITAQNNARTVVVKDDTGNLRTSGDFSLDHTNDTISFIHDGTNWLETSRSDNQT